MKDNMEFLKKFKIEPYDPAIPLLGIYLKEIKSLSQRDSCTLMFFAALFIIAKSWKQPKCSSTHKGIKKITHTHIHTHTHTKLRTFVYFIHNVLQALSTKVHG